MLPRKALRRKVEEREAPDRPWQSQCLAAKHKKERLRACGPRPGERHGVSHNYGGDDPSGGRILEVRCP